MEESQQTYDMAFRSELQATTNPILRGLNLFSTQMFKHFNLLTKATFQHITSPSIDTRKALTRNIVSMLILQSALIALLDMGKNALLGYDDDKDKKYNILFAKALANNISTLPMGNVFSNTLTNAIFGTHEYTRDVTLPVTDVLSIAKDLVSTTFRRKESHGKSYIDWDENLLKSADMFLNKGLPYLGIPVSPIKNVEQYIKNHKYDESNRR